MAETEIATGRERFAWCLFDFASSPWPTIALTAFGAPYFAKVLAPDGVDLLGIHVPPNTAWGLTASIGMGLVTLTSPAMGALADRAANKKRLLAIYVALCVVATIALAFTPARSGALIAFLLYVIAGFAFEGAYVFYNAFLPDLAPPDKIGRLSGAGWALGYVGGLAALIVCKPILPTEYTPSEASKGTIVYLVVAVWYVVFAAPAMIVLRERRTPTSTTGIFRESLRELAKTLRSVRADRAMFAFLVAYLFFTDALNTVIQFTGIYTSEVLHFSPEDNVVLFLVLNVIAAPGAYFFGRLEDRIGGIKALRITLVLWSVVVVLAMTATTKAGFWPVAGLAAVVIGATQSASRAVMARMAPREKIAEHMGLLSLSGKASSVFGPTIYGLVADLARRDGDPGFGHRVAIGAIGSLFIVAFFVLHGVDDRRRAEAPA